MSDSTPSRLPHSFTTLIGRERDIESIASLVRSASGSTITLVGPAGVGKTRLAIAVAQTIGSEFEHGIVYVDLAPISDPLQVAPSILNALGLPDREAAAGQLAQHLRDRSLLLVIDSFEQVREAAPVLNSCLADAPGVRALITSQAPLRVRGEQEFAVEPLKVPAALASDVAALDELERYRDNPSVQLFVERAQGARSAFRLTPMNLPAVAAICRHLDGIPLAIELAAARSNVLSPEALLTRLTASLHLLSGGPRDAPNRHQALQAAIEWSYSLLDPREALLLDRLSVFSGSFSLSAAEAVAGNAPIVFPPSIYVDREPPLLPDETSLDWTEIFELLDGLVEHSLVQRFETSSDEPRFRLYQTIRQLAASKLAEREGTARTALRHATFFRAIAEQGWDSDGVGLLEKQWLDELDADNENVRAALDYLTETDPATASTMAGGLIWFFYIRGRRQEGIRLIERVAGRYGHGSISPVAQARTDFAYGSLLALFPQSRAAGVAQLESVLVDLRVLGHEWATGYTLMALAVLAEDDGEYERALDLISQSRIILDRVGDAATLANVDFHIAVSQLGLERLGDARALAATVAYSTPDIAGLNVAYALHLLGMIDLAEGKLDDAARHFQHALDFSMQHGVVATATELLDSAATLQTARGRYEEAARLFGAADRHNKESGNPITFPERTYYDAARDRAQSEIGPHFFAELLAAGAARSLEAAFSLSRAAFSSAGQSSATTPLQAFPVFGSQRPYALTNRELDVLRLVAAGMSDKEIADRLFISHGTARTHVRNILGKMDVPNRSAATSIALREGLVDLSEAG